MARCSHAQITECKHTLRHGKLKEWRRCATCHTDIAAQMFDVAKLHGDHAKNSRLPAAIAILNIVAQLLR
jgi:hypothetical protein